MESLYLIGMKNYSIKLQNTKKGVFAIVFKEDKVLLGKRRDINMWNLIGGGVEKGEDLYCALSREVMEEIGATIKEIHKLKRYINGHKEKVYVFLTTLNEFEFKRTEEVSKIKYFKVNRLPENLYGSHKKRILDAYKICLKQKIG